MLNRLLRFLVPAVLYTIISLLAYSTAYADISLTDYGYEFLTIGDAGNEACYLEGSTWAWGSGDVGYKYRMSRTEVTTTQYLEFIEAYLPYYEGNPLSTNYSGEFIRGYKDGDE